MELQFVTGHAESSHGDEPQPPSTVREEEQAQAQEYPTTLDKVKGVLKKGFFTLWKYQPHIFAVISVVDVGLDYKFTHDLATGHVNIVGADGESIPPEVHGKTFRGHAMWLGVMATISVLVEFGFKFPALFCFGSDDYARGGKFGMEDIPAYAFMIFAVEDTTTLMVWWQTGTFDSSDSFASLNLAITVITTIYTILCILSRMMTREHFQNASDSSNLFGGGGQCCSWCCVFPCFVGIAVFWAWVSLGPIRRGESLYTYTQNISNTSVDAFDFEFELGSGSAYGDNINSTNSLIVIDPSANAIQINNALYGIYVTGIVAALILINYFWGGSCCGDDADSSDTTKSIFNICLEKLVKCCLSGYAEG